MNQIAKTERDLINFLYIMKKNLILHINDSYAIFNVYQFDDMFMKPKIVENMKNQRICYSIPEEFSRDFRICFNGNIEFHIEKNMDNIHKIFKELVEFLNKLEYQVDLTDIELVGPLLHKQIQYQIPITIKISKVPINYALANITLINRFKEHLENNAFELLPYIYELERNKNSFLQDYPAELLFYFPEYFLQMVDDIHMPKSLLYHEQFVYTPI